LFDELQAFDDGFWQEQCAWGEHCIGPYAAVDNFAQVLGDFPWSVVGEWESGWGG
jgi:hypothetical protein